MKERLFWVDWAKTIAIYGVVLCHCTEQNNPAWVRNVSSLLVSFHVPLFFLVSGYLFHIKEKNFVLFVKNSAKSLLIPYVFFNVVSAPILWKLQAHDVWITGMLEFFECKGHAWAGPAWFLVALFNVRLIAYGLFKIQQPWQQIAIVSMMAVVPCILPVRLWFGFTSAMIGIVFF